MKRIVCVFLTCLILFLFPACKSAEANEISFYYCRTSDAFRYFEEDGVIRTELRNITGHRNDLRYMVSLYLAGPMEEDLVSPFTNATRLIAAELTDQAVYIELSTHNKILTDAEFSLACACLTLTCMDFTSCETVTIVSGDRSVTMDANSILIFDSLPAQETTGG